MKQKKKKGKSLEGAFLDDYKPLEDEINDNLIDMPERKDFQSADQYWLNQIISWATAPLTLGQSYELASKYRENNDQLARERMLRSSIRYVISLANHYLGVFCFEQMDLIELGIIGALRGIDKYEKGHGAKVNTYIKDWINNELSRGTMKSGMLHVINDEYWNMIKVNKAMRKISADNDKNLDRKELTIEEIDERLREETKLSQEKIDFSRLLLIAGYIRFFTDLKSNNQQDKDDDEDYFLYMQRDTRPDREELDVLSEKFRKCKKFLEGLKRLIIKTRGERNQKIFWTKYGIGKDYIIKTHVCVQKKFDLKKDVVRQNLNLTFRELERVRGISKEYFEEQFMPFIQIILERLWAWGDRDNM